MDVTRQNFHSLLPELEKAISGAAFVTVDLEFTGLNSGGRELDVMPFDTPEQYYAKLHQGALDFLPVQIGVCLFHYHSKEDRYTHHAYNFYVFPRPPSRAFSGSKFLCQNSSIDFLASHNFDFNKVFRDGISYLTQTDEDRLRASVEERHRLMSDGSAKDTPDITVPDDQKANIEEISAQVKMFLDDISEDRNEEMLIEKSNRWVRRLLYQELPKKFGNAVYLETRITDCGESVMVVMRGGDPAAQKQREEDKKNREWKEFEDSVGFSHLVKYLSNSGKLIVGHNCLLDLCHMVNRFRHPLPSDYKEFKEILHHTFSRLIDTKVMASAQCFRDMIPGSDLGSLLCTLSESPFEMPTVGAEIEGRSYSVADSKAHEAGYDAYITGLCFLSLCKKLAKNAGKKLKGVESIEDLLRQYLNRLYLMKVQDIPYIQLGASDPKPPREHVFHVSFPREWRRCEVQELFKPFGPVFVSFLDERSAFVALGRRDQSRVVLKAMTESGTYKLTPFAVYQKLNERRRSPPVCARQPTSSSPFTESVRKRKLLELASDRTQSTTVSAQKKRCSLEQPLTDTKWCIDPVQKEPEPSSKDSTTVTEKSVGKGITHTSSKEFPESNSWD